MASEKQIAANRANALRSTGPTKAPGVSATKRPPEGGLCILDLMIFD
jgi:hypothetical protein